MILNAIEQGSGPPVCLLHGLFGRAQNLAAVARRLAARSRVLSLDLRNHGASPHAAGMDYRSMAADVTETLDRLGALPVRLLGHSMGGKVAMTMALQAPAQVLRLVVADIAPAAYRHHNAAVAKAMRQLALTPGLTRREADAALAAAVPDPAIRGFLLQNLAFGPAPSWRIGLDQIAAGLPDIEGWPEIHTRFDGPALFITGGSSAYVDDTHRQSIEALFPAASFVSLPGAGHWLHADQPERFANEVEAFLLAGIA